MKRMIRKSFGNKGEEIVRMNNAAVDAGSASDQRLRSRRTGKSWMVVDKKEEADVPDFIKNIAIPVNQLKGR